MTAIPDTGYLLSLAGQYSRTMRLSESRISDLAAGNPYFFARLRGGKGCTVKTYCRAFYWFSANWPEGLEWPPGVPRPEPASDLKEVA